MEKQLNGNVNLVTLPLISANNLTSDKDILLISNKNNKYNSTDTTVSSINKTLEKIPITSQTSCHDSDMSSTSTVASSSDLFASTCSQQFYQQKIALNNNEPVSPDNINTESNNVYQSQQFSKNCSTNGVSNLNEKTESSDLLLATKINGSSPKTKEVKI